jgi:hypothetical protein
MWSHDGVTWTASTGLTAAEITIGVTWSQKLGLFVAANYGALNKLYTSSDGKAWTAVTTSAIGHGFSSVAWCPGPDIFLVGSNGSVSNDGVYSYDAKIWRPMPAFSTGGLKRAIVYGPSIRTAVAITTGPSAVVEYCKF